MLKRNHRIIECDFCHNTRNYRKGSKCPFCGSTNFSILNQPTKDYLSKKQKEREEKINRLVDNMIRPRR